MTFNPEGFADMKDKYFLLNGRSYPDTVGLPAGSVSGWTGGVNPTAATTAGSPDASSNAIGTEASDGRTRFSQPLPTLITLKKGERALLRIADLDVTEYQTLASLGIPMQLIGYQAKILRDIAGNNLYVTTNSVTLGGGESVDVILDSTNVPPGTYFLYTPNLDHLSNDAENFGGLMTEVVVTP
jgi:FtsP/CotA-like multicopper oxidase with cupredoxin domain